ncbi:protein of unknown function [Verrucomicrobium sp. GAS474]|uniref:hypothetical protein n=1 Tax=Verrucomicrobium sp. GAS474 TaxID=1882831 RepID=UPI00087A247D|nr:hypothetical protein [Verrucomicrobium sp. GAS474]SDT93188.1 protein of unknown function [Verrucomicrobium sp. GAS474]
MSGSRQVPLACSFTNKKLMNATSKARVLIITRCDELILEGKAFVESIRVIPPHTRGNVHISYTSYDWDSQRLARWKTNCLTLFDPFVKSDSKFGQQIDIFSKAGGKKPEVQYSLGILEAFRDDLEKGFLDSIFLKIEAEVAADYMGQAESLLRGTQTSSVDHVPAAVLAGAVLEKGLRTLCGQQQPPLEIIKSNGEPKTLGPLIDDLKTSGAFNELKAKQLRAWADIRNKAAHGEFDQFKKTDVEQMIQGVTNFLADYLA